MNVGRWAFEHALQVDKSDVALFVLMANIYTTTGMQEGVENIETMIKENKAWKEQKLALSLD